MVSGLAFRAVTEDNDWVLLGKRVNSPSDYPAFLRCPTSEAWIPDERVGVIDFSPRTSTSFR
jgi:hypothetical protein